MTLPDFQVVKPKERDLEYQFEYFQDKFHLRANYEAKNFRLIESASLARSAGTA
jgi:protease II